MYGMSDREMEGQAMYQSAMADAAAREAVNKAKRASDVEMRMLREQIEELTRRVELLGQRQ